MMQKSHSAFDTRPAADGDKIVRLWVRRRRTRFALAEKLAKLPLEKIKLFKNGKIRGVSFQKSTKNFVFLAKSSAERSRIADIRFILRKIESFTMSKRRAKDWYNLEQIPAFGGLTPAELVRGGREDALHRYLDHLELGGFA